MQSSTKFDPFGSWGIFLPWKKLWTLHHWYLIYTSFLLTFTTAILATDYWLLTGVGKWHCYICLSLAICTPKFSNLDNVSLKSLLFCTALRDTWVLGCFPVSPAILCKEWNGLLVAHLSICPLCTNNVEGNWCKLSMYLAHFFISHIKLSSKLWMVLLAWMK